LPRTSRITRAADLRALLTQGKRRRTDHLDLFTRPSPVGRSRLAVVVPRHGRTAVARNRLRRQVREIGRRCVLPVLEGPLDVGIRARPGAYEATFDHLRLEIVAALCPSSRASSSC
jgi:ribonuclease P protein component